MSNPPPWDDNFARPASAVSPPSWAMDLAHETASRSSPKSNSQTRSPVPQNDRRTVSDNYPRSPVSEFGGSMGGGGFYARDLLHDDESDFEHENTSPKHHDKHAPSLRPILGSSPGVGVKPTISKLLDAQRLVIGIDFGTTHSGIAYATPSDEHLHELSDIYLVTNYGFGMTNDFKIPSVISYSDPSTNEVRKEHQFGRDLSPNAIAMVNSKLELDVQESKLAELESLVHALEGMRNLSYANVKRSKGHPGFTWKSAEQIVTDYLAKVFKAFSAYLDKKHPEAGAMLREKIPTDLVITVPADWSAKAKNSTYRAVINAGFNQKSFLGLKKVFMVTEPEAAALYGIRWLKEEKMEYLREDDSFVLCDAGGGTVDVVAYRIASVSPRVVLEQITIATSRKCGSIYIDARFKEWLRGHLGKQWRVLDPKSVTGRINAQMTEGQHMRTVMAEFEDQKKAFKNEQGEIKFRLPGDLKDITVGTAIVGGQVIISQRQMKTFFDESVDGVLALIRDQVVQAEDDGKRVTNIIMVGGFAESPYLEREIRKSMEYRDITLHRPSDSWTAVARGAVISGIEHMGKLVPLQACPKNYGICLNEDFSGLHDNWDDRFLEESTSRVVALGQMHWLILKGDMLRPGEPREHIKICPFTFSETQSRIWDFEIYEWDTDNPRVKLPKSYHNTRKELKSVLNIEINLSAIQLEDMLMTRNDGRPYWTAETECRMTYTANHVLDVQFMFRGQIVGKGTKTMIEPSESRDDDDDYDDENPYYDSD